MSSLKENLDALKMLRESLKKSEAAVRENQEIVNKVPEYSVLVSAKVTRDQLRDAVSKIEDLVREQAVLIYRSDGNKNPLPGVVIKIFKKLNYDAKQMEEWARQYVPAVFKFNKESFEKVAIELDAPVRVEECPQVQIAAELP